MVGRATREWRRSFAVSAFSVAAILALSVLGAPAPAAGAPAAADGAQREQARLKVAEGVKLLEASQWAAALARFDAAFATFPSPKIQYNRGLALRSLGRHGEAFMAFERFLRETKDPAPEHVNHARAELERLARKVAFVSLACDVAGAEVLLDGRTVGVTPLPGRIPVDTGPHEITAGTAEQGRRSLRFTAIAGEPLELKIPLRQGAAGDAIRPPPVGDGAPPSLPAVTAASDAGIAHGAGGGGSTLPPAAGSDLGAPHAQWMGPARWVTAGAAGAALGAGVFFHLRGISKREEFDQHGSASSPPQRCGVDPAGKTVGGNVCVELANAFTAARRNAIIAYVVSGALAAGSAALFLLHAREEAAAPVAWSPAVGPDLLGVSFAARF